MFEDLAGKSALVTGASSGLGLHLARLLAGHGVRVVLGARRVEALEHACAGIAATGGTAVAVPLDVTNAASIEAALAAVEGGIEWTRFGIRVNALCPGYVETDINRDFFANPAGEALVRRIPQRRLGALEDLDAPLLLLFSDAGAYMTRAVDGGHLASSL